MKALLKKEFTLASSILSYLFMLFAFMALIPGYPILVGTFFVCLGIFQSFQYAREAGDIHYSALLPVSKKDIAAAKCAFTYIIQLTAFLVMAVCTVLRWTVLRSAAAYTNNVMMNATPYFLGMVLFIFAEFNLIFVAGFFKTAYWFAKPFVFFIIVSMLTIAVAETLHFIPPLAFLNQVNVEALPVQCAVLAVGAVLYAVSAVVTVKVSSARMERVDL